MCGRFTQAYTWSEVHAFLNVFGTARNLQPRYNIAPTTTVDVVIDRGQGHEIVPMRWGLVPGWWKKTLKDLPATFNARAESVAEKPMFRDAFRRRRCIIPASGFYEWTTEADGKQPHYFTAADGTILAFAGLWAEWHDPASGEVLLSCTIIVTGASGWMKRFHDRMPMLLEAGDFDAWLRGEAGPEVLKPAEWALLQEWPVSRRVNRPGNDDDPTLIEAVAP